METLAAMEKKAIKKAVRSAHGDKLLAAERLGIGKTTIYRKLKEMQPAKRKRAA